MVRKEPQTVLVVDDEPDIVIIVQNALHEITSEVVSARNGELASKRLSESLPDLLILDVMMPDCSGHEVASYLRSLPGGEFVPILMLTAVDTLDDKVSALQSGIDDYLAKPFQVRELQARVQSLLRVRSLMVMLQEKNQQLEELQEHIVERERQSVVTQLAGTAAHELGQPLSAITLNLHLLKKEGVSESQRTEIVDAMLADAERMSSLLGSLQSVKADATEEYDGDTRILQLEKEPQ